MKHNLEIIGEWFSKNKPNAELLVVERQGHRVPRCQREKHLLYHIAFAIPLIDDNKDIGRMTIDGIFALVPVSYTIGHEIEKEYTLKVVDYCQVSVDCNGYEVDATDIIPPFAQFPILSK